MNDMSIPSPDLPADARLETLAVRDGLPPSPWGENSEALFLTSCFVHPDAATAAAASPTRKRPSSTAASPTPTSPSWSAPGGAGRAEACIGTSQRHGRDPAAGDGPAEGRRPRDLLASVFGSTIKLLQGEFGKFGVETSFVSQTDVAQWKRGGAAQHEAAVRRDADQPADRGVRHPRAGRHRARAPARCWRWTTACARRRCSSR
jgi:O-succinylhomoserine sulfhydrylase